MNPEQMKQAGEFTQQSYFTDNELTQIIEATKLTYAYLFAKGEGWALAYRPLKLELEVFETILERRKLSKTLDDK